MAERDIRRAIMAALRGRGAYVASTTGAIGQRGLPDLLACYRGSFLAIEVKRPGGRLTPLQAHTIEAVRNAGGRAIMATSVEDVIAVLDAVDNHPRRNT